MKKEEFIYDSDLPLDLQTGGENNENLNDDDCLFFMLMNENRKLRSYEDGKIRHTNSSIASILQDKFPACFIRTSLGKLSREGLLQIQLKIIPKVGLQMREITLTGKGITNPYFKDWLYRNSTEMEEPFKNEYLSPDLQIDIYNAEPLNDGDFIIFFLIDRIGDGEEGNTIGLANSRISECCKSHYSIKEIYHSLGKLAREGLIQVKIFETPQSTLFREIKVIPGFGAHPALANWVDNFKKQGLINKQPKKTEPKEPMTNEDVPMLPLPMDVSWALRSIEANLFGYDDNFIDLSKIESMSKFMYDVFAGGVKNNMAKLKLTQKIWKNIKKHSPETAMSNYGSEYFLLADYRFRIHLEALRLLSGKSLMDILYQGEINVQNEFTESDFQLYLKVCDQIWSMIEQDQSLDLTQLTLEDIQKEIKKSA